MTKLQQAHANAPVWTPDYQRQSEVLTADFAGINRAKDAQLAKEAFGLALLTFAATCLTSLLLAA